MSQADSRAAQRVKASVRQQFGPVAQDYVRSEVHRTGQDLEAMLDAAEIQGDERVLDLGSGGGHSALAFSGRAREVVGVDLTPEMIDASRALAAERGVENLRFQQADAEDLPFERASFDRVITRQVFHHLPRPRAALAQARRVLRPGGIFVAVDTVAPEDDAQDAFLHRIEMLHDSSHVRDHRVSEWCEMLAEAGLRDPECLGRWMLELEFDDWVHRSRTPPECVERIRREVLDASQAVRDALGFDGGPTFRIPGALIRARG